MGAPVLLLLLSLSSTVNCLLFEDLINQESGGSLNKQEKDSSMDKGVKGFFDMLAQHYKEQKDMGVIRCATFENQVHSVTTCQRSDEISMGIRPNGLSCYSLSGPSGLISRGCWIHQEESLSQCTDKCVGGDKTDGFQFCCCKTDECNH